jgi:hypothetical protein
MVQLLFQSRAVGGLGRGIVGADRNETRTEGGAKTNKGCSLHEMTVPVED